MPTLHIRYIHGQTNLFKIMDCIKHISHQLFNTSDVAIKQTNLWQNYKNNLC